MSRKPMRSYQLPLLGSNQDSPDPESGTPPNKEGADGPEGVGMVQNTARTAPEVPTIPHTTAKPWSEIEGLPFDEFIVEQERWLRERAAGLMAPRLAPDPEPRKRRPTKRQPRHGRASRRSTWLKRYQLTPAQYDAMLAAQGGVCAICRSLGKRRPCVDHCHATGAIRGLLCNRCNSGIGHFFDRPDLLIAAVAYLERGARVA